jgi:hypothetical protein
MRYETGAAADGADQSLADMVIPQSTAALAGLLMLAGGRQGLSPDEALRAGSQRRRSRRNTTE